MKVLESLPDTDEHRIIAHIELLETNPRPAGAKKLKGMDGRRIRVGDYRVVYKILEAEKIVLLTKVAHRKDVYR
ncbi:MAG: type II toxin-antitoxin system RelE/ParE family toxin [Ignavibacteriae bacterium]|nr:type II toxin-antitoxin system RelE/ParE family toxin [Ignavibacteriota bacterium]